MPSQTNAPAGDVVKPHEQLARGRFADARHADQRNRFPLRKTEGNVSQHRDVWLVTEIDMVELDIESLFGWNGGVRGVDDNRLGVEQFEDPLGTGSRFLQIFQSGSPAVKTAAQSAPDTSETQPGRPRRLPATRASPPVAQTINTSPAPLAASIRPAGTNDQRLA